MPDLSAPVGAILEIVGPVLKPAVRTILSTAAGMMLLASGTQGLSLYIVWDCGPGAIAAASVLTLVVSVVIGWMLSIKNAITAALLVGVTRFELGKRSLALVFDRLLAIADDQTFGDRGTSAAIRLERLPLREAETRLRKVIDMLVGQRAQLKGIRAYFARKIQHSTLRRVEILTLQSFREADADYGGVDLIRVRDELSARINSVLENAIRAAGQRLLYFSITLVLVTSIGAALVIRLIAEK